MTSFSQRAAALVLRSCQQQQPGSRIASVLRDGEGRTVIRVSAGSARGGGELQKALQQLWPLAETSLLENALDASLQTEITIPREKDEWLQARLRARASSFSKISLAVALVFFALGACMYAADLSSPPRHAEL